jgi:hypothetical protein
MGGIDMNPHIEYLKQLKAHGQTVVAIDYILKAFDTDAPQTDVKVPQRRFDNTEGHLHFRESKRVQNASRALKTKPVFDPEIERQIREYAKMKKRSKSS